MRRIIITLIFNIITLYLIHFSSTIIILIHLLVTLLLHLLCLCDLHRRNPLASLLLFGNVAVRISSA